MSKRANSLEEFLNFPNNFNSLSIKDRNITVQECISLATALRSNTTVVMLQISNTEIGDTISILTKALKVNKTLTQLDFRQNHIGDIGVSSLAEVLKVNKTVTQVYLQQNLIGDLGASSLAEVLKVNNTVIQVHLQQNQIGDFGASSFAEALKVNKTVTQIYLHQNQIGDIGASNLAEALKVNKTVTQVYLHQNQIGDAGACNLAEALKVNKAVAQLNLHNNQIGNLGASSLGEALKINNTVVLLHLQNNQIGDIGASSLGEALKINNTVVQLSLHSNQIGDIGTRCLGEALKINDTLTQISLHNNKIGDIGASNLAEAFKVNNTISYLDLQQNQVGEIGASSLAEALKSNNTVTHLYLAQNRIGDVGVSNLAGALEVNNTVTHLYLYQNQIRDVGASILSNALQINTSLELLNLQTNQITSQSCEFIKDNWNNRNAHCHLENQNPYFAVQEGRENHLVDNDKFANDYALIALNDDKQTLLNWFSTGFEMAQVDNQGRTLLWYVTVCNNIDMARILLNHTAAFACMRLEDKDGYSPLGVAVLLKKDEIINLAIDRLVQYMHSGEEFDDKVADLLLPREGGEQNKRQFLESWNKHLVDNGINTNCVEDYKQKLPIYLKDLLPAYFVDNVVIVTECLYFNRSKVMNRLQTLLTKILGTEEELDLVKVMENSEWLISLLIHSKELKKAFYELKKIMLTQVEKQVFENLIKKYDSLDQYTVDLIKQNYSHFQANGYDWSKSVNIAEIRLIKAHNNAMVLENNQNIRSEKHLAKPKTKKEEKLKEYVPEMDFSKTQLFEVQEEAVQNDNKMIRRISKLINEGNNHLQVMNKKGILLLGDTGVGKSTLAHLLSGRELKAMSNDETGEFTVEFLQPAEDIRRGHKTVSDTLLPHRGIAATNAVIWDCPGFNDSDNVQEIVNSFFVKKLFETTEYLKFVLVVPEGYITINKGNQFLATLSNFLKTFADAGVIMSSVSLVVTQVAPHKKNHHIVNSIKKMLDDNQGVTEEHRLFVTKIMHSSLHLFYKPTQEGVLEVENLFEAIDRSYEYLQSDPSLVSISLSEKGMECSQKLLNTASDSFNRILEVMVKAITYVDYSLSENLQNIFLQNHALVKEWLPSSIDYVSLQDHKANKYFLKIDLLSKLYKSLEISNVSSIIEGISVLQKVASIIAEYTETEIIKKQIQEFSYCLQQQYEYIRFFSEICVSELPNHSQISELLSICKEKVAENLEYQVSTLNVKEEGHDSAYYNKAIKYLENYPESSTCQKLKAFCLNSLAGLAELAGDDTQVIACYIRAIEVNHQQPETYEKLGRLFFDKGNYAKAIECYQVVNNEFKIKACFKAWLKQDSENPHIMLKQAEYFESIGLFEKAKTYYHHTFSLSQDENFKATALEKIGNIMLQAATQGESFITRAAEHDFYNYDLVNSDFIHNLLGDTHQPADFSG